MKIVAANSDAWSIAKGKDPNNPSVLRFRPSLQHFLADANYPRRLTIVWTFEVTDSSGMPSDTQSADMKVFEDRLLEALDPDLAAILAFVYTTRGTREWHFYLSDVNEVGIRINQALASVPKLPIQLNVEDDPNWDELRQVFLTCARQT
ncbi:DUF695 domain-containing protein [Coraliomargarita sp. SDUM461004]|uniref:DUF695 domain-containing protein n=1 Tax=Thalassobacterium sedimentorum TaxID=3041258 RepID=A0ABU1AKL4_9BACT|nr:DUF695 domain-containing protein [Coraliomargarita sp. SDUM461004]MDQ8195346.1 DUF695 domain-containing protein [Coraliomargarita sp. SDUM461004]